MVIPIKDTTFPITTRTTTTGSVRLCSSNKDKLLQQHIDQTVTKRATKTITTIINAEVTTLLTDIVTATVSSTTNLPLVLREVYCNIRGDPDGEQYGISSLQVGGDASTELIFTRCKDYCSFVGAISFGFDSEFCLCFRAGAQTVANVNSDRDFHHYDLACDTAEQPSIQRARSHGAHLVKRDDHISLENLVVTAGPHFDKRDDRVPIPNWLPGPRDPATISGECLCLFTKPKFVVLS
ncbi:uncharacterized protein FSUBG_12843, partial [Fusarium subglutinans]